MITFKIIKLHDIKFIIIKIIALLYNLQMHNELQNAVKIERENYVFGKLKYQQQSHT